MSKQVCRSVICLWEQRIALTVIALVLLCMVPPKGCSALGILWPRKLPFSSSHLQSTSLLNIHLAGRHRPVGSFPNALLSNYRGQDSSVKRLVEFLEKTILHKDLRFTFSSWNPHQHSVRIACGFVVLAVFLLRLGFRFFSRKRCRQTMPTDTLEATPCAEAESYVLRSHIKRATKLHQLNSQSQVLPRDFSPVKFWLSGLAFPLRARLSPGRGDCLFLSVAAALFVAAFESYLDFDSTELKDTASSLRELAVDTLENGGDTPLVLEGDEWISCSRLLHLIAYKHGCTGGEYCRRMRQPLTWGGGPEIVALANILGRPVAVYTIQREQSHLASNGYVKVLSQQVQRGILGKQERTECKGKPLEAHISLRLCKVFGWAPDCKEEPLHLLFASSQSLEQGIQETSPHHFVPLVPDPEFISRTDSSRGVETL